MEAFFALACLSDSIVIALMIVHPIHPGAHVRMQYLAVPHPPVLEIFVILLNTLNLAVFLG